MTAVLRGIPLLTHPSSICIWMLVQSFVAAASVSATEAQDTQPLAARLLSDDRDTKYAALQMVGRLAPEDIGDELRTALIRLGERVNNTVAETQRSGRFLADIEDPEYVADVLRQVARIRDPRTIAVLAEGGFYGGGNAIDAILTFGEAAIPALVRVAQSDDHHYDVVSHALVALGAIVEAWQPERLSTTSRNDLIRLVNTRLERKPARFSVTWYAMDLGFALGDSAQAREIERIANDTSELRARGITEPHIQELTRTRVTAQAAFPSTAHLEVAIRAMWLLLDSDAAQEFDSALRTAPASDIVAFKMGVMSTSDDSSALRALRDSASTRFLLTGPDWSCGPTRVGTGDRAACALRSSRFFADIRKPVLRADTAFVAISIYTRRRDRVHSLTTTIEVASDVTGWRAIRVVRYGAR